MTLSQHLDTLVRTGNGWTLAGRLSPLSEFGGAFVQPSTHSSKDGKGKQQFQSPYLLMQRRMENQDVACVTLNTVQAEANVNEEVLERKIREEAFNLFFPQIRLDIPQLGLNLSTAELPHRCVAAQLRDAEIDGVGYRESDIGTAILNSCSHDMTGIYRYDPRSILHGVWDSHAFVPEKTQRQKTNQTLRLQRFLNSEITGVGVRVRDRRAQLNDPLHFSADLPLKDADLYKDEYYRHVKEDKPSSAGLSSVPAGTPGQGGVSMDYAIFENNAAMGVLRGYRFPISGEHDKERDHAARVVIASLGLLALSLRVEAGFALRSGCDLLWDELPEFKFYGRCRKEVIFQGEVSPAEAYAVYEKAYAKAKDMGLGWEDRVYTLTPCEAFQKRIAKNLEWTSDKSEA